MVENLALSLSGGGLRATLFHLGVIARLQEHDLLRRVRYVCGVSGGAIMAAHLVQSWDDYNRKGAFERVASEVKEFARSDVRNRIIRRLPLYLLSLFVPRWHHTPSHMLIGYLRELFGERTMRDLARCRDLEKPILEILSTNLTTGEWIAFGYGCIIGEGIQPNSNGKRHVDVTRALHDERRCVNTDVEVAFAVGASSAFPGFFPPLETSAEFLRISPSELGSTEVYLTDGGVFSNTGIQRLHELEANFRHILISDATATFDWALGRRFQGIVGAANRSVDIMMSRIATLSTEVTYQAIDDTRKWHRIGISDIVEGNGHPLTPERQQLLQHIRTDLDAFSDHEIESLFQHGYHVTGMTLKRIL